MAIRAPQLVKPPLRVQRGLFTVLAPIGRLVGRQAVYPKYKEILRERDPALARKS